MRNQSKIIREKSLTRLADIFKVKKEKISDDINLSNFKPSFKSFFKRNEFDIVYDDIRDAASNKILKKLESGEIVINTVGDYINYMIMCYEDCPKMVESIFGEISLSIV